MQLGDLMKQSVEDLYTFDSIEICDVFAGKFKKIVTCKKSPFLNPDLQR